MKKCLFEPQHLIPLQTYNKHLEKCKSQNKRNFEQCPYNKTHWIKFNKMGEHIKQHEKNKQKKLHFDQDDSVIGNLLDQLQKNEDVVTFEEFKKDLVEKQKNIPKKKNKKKEKWEEPCFEKWFNLNYGKTAKNLQSKFRSGIFPNQDENFMEGSGFDFQH